MRALKKPFSFKGRFNRFDFIFSIFFAIVLTYMVGGILLGIGLLLWNEPGALGLGLAPGLVSLIASGKKRLNDLGLPGWLQLLYPLTFFIMLFKRGTDEDNEHGPSLHITKKSTDHLDNVKREDIPNACPSCKNPNSQKLLVCEWCGNRIV